LLIKFKKKIIRTWYEEFTEVKIIDAPKLTRVWQDLEYRIDVCSVNRGAHIKHL
jgi:hypothetical protein